MEDMRNEAALAEKKAMVSNLITLGKLLYEEIAKCTNLSVEEVEELAGQKRA